MTNPLPSGIVTLLLTDIEGSVDHWERDPEAMPDAVELHEHLLATAIEAGGGHLLKSKGEGDSTFSVFAVADAAVSAAFKAQQALSEVAWPTARPVRVRMAIHSGKVIPRDSDYYGPVPNRAALLRQIAHGGQAIASTATEVLARRLLPPELQLRPLGRHRLRDLSEAEEVYQVDSRRAPATFPPLKSVDDWPNNLPTLLASFVGRELELTDIRDDLGANRLVTLVGSPGVGKTRLSLQVGAELLHEYPDGVWFIELAAVQDAATLAMALATALHVRPEDDPLGAVVGYARSRRLLFIFDNCEHVLVPAAAAMRTILSQCPRVNVLATSRGSLNLDIEQLSDVHPLPLPAEDAVGHAVETSDAVHLFTARAHASSALSLTEANAAHVVRICRAVEGIPLALEMAAAWTRVLGVRQIADRLQDGQFMLEWVHPDPDAGYRSFDEAIRWSWDLLPESARSLCGQLAVFEGGARLGSLEALTQRECLNDLATLVRQSLVQRTEDAAGHSRYRMHALVRDFAIRQLAADGVEGDTRDRHARLFLEFAEQASEAMRGPSLAEWRPRLDDEQSNIQGAFRHLVEQSQVNEALRLSSALWFYNYMRGSFTEGRALVEQALALRTPETPKDLEARALHAAGTLAAVGSTAADARGYLEPAAAIWRELGDIVALANTVNNLAITAERDHDYRGAAALYAEALDLRTVSGDVRGSISTLTNLAQVRMLVAELDQAEEAVRRGVELVNEVGDDRLLGDLLLRMAVIDIDRGNFESAERIITQCCAIAERLDYRVLLAGAEMERGRLWLNTGQFELATTHMLRSLRHWRRQGNGTQAASVTRHLGDIAYHTNNLPAARRRYRSSLSQFKRDEDLWLLSTVKDSLGRVALAEGQIELARSLMAEAFDQRRVTGRPMPLIESIESAALLVAAQGRSEMAADLAARAEALRSSIGVPRPPLLVAHFVSRIAGTTADGQPPSNDTAGWNWFGVELDDVAESARRCF